jgi:hypothetical protein
MGGEEHPFTVSENMALRRIFAIQRIRSIETWRKLHNEELHNLCYSIYIIRMAPVVRTR